MINKYKNILFLFILFGLTGCESIIDSIEKPGSNDRESSFKIVLTDKSGNLQKLYGTNAVANADILLKSNSLGTEFRGVTDSTGTLTVTGLISDKYLVSANRILSANEMYELTGIASVNYKLTNKDVSLIDLDASSNKPVEIPMTQALGSSPLLLSELYVCGPQGSGLYYHDKYIEVYNNSDSVLYLDKIVVALVYVNSYLGIDYHTDPDYVHSKCIWKFPGSGHDYPIKPGQYVVCAEDAIDHRINAPNSVDLSHADFEFYKDDAPDIDITGVPNMIKIYQTSGNDWTPAAEKGAIVLAQVDEKDIKVYDDHWLIPIDNVIDGVEYLSDVTKLDEKILTSKIDAGATGGIQFYTGKSMERSFIIKNGKSVMSDENNSSLDFKVYQHPSPGYHN